MKNLTQTSAQLYECRDTMKTILGDKYHATIKKWGEPIKTVMALKKCDEISAAVEIAKKADDPMSTVSILAAAVEMVEPS